MKNKKAFTLVELIAVIVLLSIIIVVITKNVLNAMQNTRGNSLAVRVKSVDSEFLRINTINNSVSINVIKNIIQEDNEFQFIDKININDIEKTEKGSAIIYGINKNSKFNNFNITDKIKQLKNKIILNNGQYIKVNDSNIEIWKKNPLFYTKIDIVICDDSEPPITDTTKPITTTKPEVKPNPPKTYAKGQHFCITNSECFYTLSDTSDTVTGLAEKNLDLTKYYQSDAAPNVKFANGSANTFGYWAEKSDKWYEPYKIKQGYYGNPPSVFDRNTYAYSYLMSYKTYYRLDDIRLPYFTELKGLGCTTGENATCNNSEFKWVVNGQSYWTQSVESAYEVWTVSMNGNFQTSYYYLDNCGIRPVITVKKSEVISS